MVRKNIYINNFSLEGDFKICSQKINKILYFYFQSISCRSPKLSLLRIIYFLNCHLIAKKCLLWVLGFERYLITILFQKHTQFQSHVNVLTENPFETEIQIVIAYSKHKNTDNKHNYTFLSNLRKHFLPRKKI